ncbi:dihydropteroate synthase [Pigmentiphaga aceris]|uniref:Dihydropteroate synthase n=1 Tax=Pigmentiphaga aceris TaxID=1940612 RepID=A0A5C0AXJ8_9BURK|nr:dihydropteroate synthase [Pigmentiphaga aceris]QEI05560.1 dihydropteroate synthase [Pigmentiphaga aceris]
MNSLFLCGRFELSLARPLVMGIVNVTPDSFSDGGQHARLDAAIAHARHLVAEGADMLDIGGESTRPGSDSVPEDEELRRVVPLIEALVSLNVPLSVDTCKPAVMRAALRAGADMINDIMALQADGALAVAQDYPASGLCIMHMQGEPRTMQAAPVYDDVVEDVAAFLCARLAVLDTAGIDPRRVVLDPGFGFGKTVEQNYRLLRELPRFGEIGLPVLAGVSRKSMIGALTGRQPAERVAGSVAAALASVARGAAIVRVHDVAQTVDALKVWQAVESPSFFQEHA